MRQLNGVVRLDLYMRGGHVLVAEMPIDQAMYLRQALYDRGAVRPYVGRMTLDLVPTPPVYEVAATEPPPLFMELGPARYFEAVVMVEDIVAIRYEIEKEVQDAQ